MSLNLQSCAIPSPRPGYLPFSDAQRRALLQGEVFAHTQPHTAWGGAVTAQMYIAHERAWVWQAITNYGQWVRYFPDVIRSQVIANSHSGCKRLYQAAEKAFLFFSAQVEIYLQVFEQILDKTRQQISFRLEQGSFLDFSADLTLEDWESGTLLTYSVQATPLIPVPSLILERAMCYELPVNMRVMRQVLCAG